MSQKTIDKIPERPRSTVKTALLLHSVDLKDTKAIGLSTSRCGKIYLTKRGIKDEKRIITQVKQLFEDLKKRYELNIDICTPEELYGGKCRSKDGKLFIVSRDKQLSINSSLESSLEVHPTKPHPEHDFDGIFFAHGTEIAKGKKVSGVEIIDLTPTILHMFSLPIPVNMNGEVLSQIFRKTSPAAERKVRYESIEKRLLSKKIKELKRLRKI